MQEMTVVEVAQVAGGNGHTYVADYCALCL